MGHASTERAVRATMNNVEAIRKLNERELELGLAGGPGSWHSKYAHSSVVYVGGLAEGMTEGDVLSVFEQVGRIMHINMVRDDQTGKPRGFCFLKYKDQRSTILAVDNFNGVEVYDKTLRVDHVDKYAPPDPAKVKLLDLTGNVEKSQEEMEKTSAKRPKVDSVRIQMDEDARRKKVMQRLAMMRRRRAAEEAADRVGVEWSPGGGAEMPLSETPGVVREASLADEANPEELRLAQEQRRTGKLARRVERQLIREERDKRRDEKRRRREGNR